MVGNSSFFCKERIVTPLSRLSKNDYQNRVERNNLVLDVIRIHHPLTKYKLAQITGISYSTIKRLTKELEFCELIYIKRQTGTNGWPIQIISIIRKEGENDS